MFNELAGPVPMSESTLLKTSDPSKLWRYNVTVSADQISSPVYQDVNVYQNRDTGKQERVEVTSTYQMLVLNDALLMVRLRGDQLSTAKHHSGALVMLPQDVRDNLGSNLSDSVRKSLLPVMLDETRFDGTAPFWLSVFVCAIGFALWNIKKYLNRRENPSDHPISAQLKKYGNPNQVALEIEQEMKNPMARADIACAILTPSWLIIRTIWGAHVVKLEDLLWVYPKEVHHSINFIPTGTSRSMIFGTNDKRLLEVSCSQREITKLMHTAATLAPWVYKGYAQDVHAAWYNNFQEMCDNVEAAKQELRMQRAA